MTRKKVVPKLKTYDIIIEAVERGLDYGYRRAHKHTDDPEENFTKQQLLDAVMSELCEVIKFEG